MPRWPTGAVPDQEGSPVIKTMSIEIVADKTQLPEIALTGEWTMREILALQGLIIKAYRKHMSGVRNDIKGD